MQRAGRALDVAGTHKESVLSVDEEVVRGADPLREDEREPACGRLVHDDTPRLSLREQRKDVGGNVELDELLPLGIPEKHRADVELGGEPLEVRALGAVSGEHEEEPRIGRGS